MKDSSQTRKTTIYRIKKIFLLCLSCTLFTWTRASYPEWEQYTELNLRNPLHKYAEGIANPITDLRVRLLFSFTISAENPWQETADRQDQALPANSASLGLLCARVWLLNLPCNRPLRDPCSWAIIYPVWHFSFLSINANKKLCDPQELPLPTWDIWGALEGSRGGPKGAARVGSSALARTHPCCPCSKLFSIPKVNITQLNVDTNELIAFNESNNLKEVSYSTVRRSLASTLLGLRRWNQFSQGHD